MSDKTISPTNPIVESLALPMTSGEQVYILQYMYTKFMTPAKVAKVLINIPEFSLLGGNILAGMECMVAFWEKAISQRELRAAIPEIAKARIPPSSLEQSYIDSTGL